MKVLSASLCSFLRTGRLCVTQRRWKSKNTSKRFSRTLHLPETTFALTMKDGAAVRREIDIQREADFDKLYGWQAKQSDRPTFVLHDGPPYANGVPHVGHALNKILKDITNRFKLMKGFRVSYVPGWDCHGLPIEQKALSEIKADHRTMDPVEIRLLAQKFAEGAIQKQMEAFRRWGVMADWSSCYYTFDRDYEADQLDVFYDMYAKGLIYQDFMPVFWSPSSRTALAEAEMEYKEDHVSTAVYVKFPLTNISKLLSSEQGIDKAYAVIWTTTPWTLPANQAICYGSGIKYSILKNLSNGDVYVVATNAADVLSSILKTKLEELGQVEGSNLEGLTYIHPLTGKTQPLLMANHVTMDKGTGLVHTAPAHGVEDFQVANNNKLTVECLVDEDGRYTTNAGPDLAGIGVQDEGSAKVLDLLSENVLHQESYTHSYPYDWRTKKPVIIRASRQWFVDTSAIKSKAQECINDVEITPKSSGKGMLSQLDMRTYWCISRQRVWGVPIPVFYEKVTGKPLITRPFMDHLQSLVRKHGADCWWTLPDEQLLPVSVREAQSDFPADAEFTKGTDVMDIWFDSGSSWASVLKGEDKQTADVYLEGLDQFGGWFQSSLLTSVAVQGKAPYKSLVVHGFTLDEEGKKMSKSVGNVVDPDTVINGSTNPKTSGYGADVLRWWAAWSGLDPKVHIGPSILQQSNEQLFRMRKTLRYLMGNLSDFEPSELAVDFDSLWLQDQHLLYQVYETSTKVNEAYESFQYAKALRILEKFTNREVASYLHLSKDRIYCGHGDGTPRRACQTVQFYVLEALYKSLAPVVPHLSEEVFQNLPYVQTEDSVFKTSWFHGDSLWSRQDMSPVFDFFNHIKGTMNTVMDNESSVIFDVVICCKGEVFDWVKRFQEPMSSSDSPLVEILGCSTVSVLSRPPLVIPDEAMPVEGTWIRTLESGQEEAHSYLLVVLPAENFQCERCRRYTAPRADLLCERCTEVLGSGWE